MKLSGNLKKIYMIGIGGIGMSALARYFNRQNIVVSGYDKTATELTEKHPYPYPCPTRKELSSMQIFSGRPETAPGNRQGKLSAGTSIKSVMKPIALPVLGRLLRFMGVLLLIAWAIAFSLCLADTGRPFDDDFLTAAAVVGGVGLGITAYFSFVFSLTYQSVTAKSVPGVLASMAPVEFLYRVRYKISGVNAQIGYLGLNDSTVFFRQLIMLPQVESHVLKIGNDGLFRTPDSEKPLPMEALEWWLASRKAPAVIHYEHKLDSEKINQLFAVAARAGIRSLSFENIAVAGPNFSGNFEWPRESVKAVEVIPPASLFQLAIWGCGPLRLFYEGGSFVDFTLINAKEAAMTFRASLGLSKTATSY